MLADSWLMGRDGEGNADTKIPPAGYPPTILMVST